MILHARRAIRLWSRPTVLARPAVLLLVLLAALPRSSSAQALTLSEAVRSTLASHPSMSVAEARARGADAALSGAQAARFPALTLDASLTRFEEPMVVAPLHAFDPTRPPRFDESLVQGSLRLAYTLFDAGERSSRIRGAGATGDAADVGRRVAEGALIEEIARAYLAVLTTRAVDEAAQAQVRALEAEADRARQRVEAGTAAEVEVLRATATFQDAVAQAAATEAHAALAERGLARLMGLEATALAGRPLEDWPVFVPGGAVLEAALAASGRAAAAPAGPPASTSPDAPATASAPGALPDPTTTNPELLRAASQVRAAEASVAEQRAGRFPRLSVHAGLLDFGTLEGGHLTEWQAGVGLSWPLFTGGARTAAIRRAEAELHAAQGQLASVELAVAGRLDAARTALAEAQALTDALASSVAQWTEVARIEQLALDAGAGVQSDLLAAQAGLFRARAGHARARYDAALAWVQLARAEGALDRTWIERLAEAPQ